jgi:hypothetical protein
MLQPLGSRWARGRTSSRTAHALHAARAFDSARRSHYDMQAPTSHTGIDAMMDADNAQKEIDPRPPGGSAELQQRTKAELKRFEYTPRSTLVDFRIPKTVSHTATSDAMEDTGSVHSLGFDASRDESGHAHVLDHQPSRGRGTPRGMRGSSQWHPTHYHNYWGPDWAEYDYPEEYGYYDSSYGGGYEYEGEPRGGEESSMDFAVEEHVPAGAPARTQPAAAAAVTPAAPVSDDNFVVTDQLAPDANEGILQQPEWDLNLILEHEAALGTDVGPALNPRLTVHLNKLWKKGSTNRIKDLHDKHPRPEGTTLFKTSLNEHIAAPMLTAPQNSPLKFPLIRDIKLKAVQGLIVRSAVPSGKICEQLMRKDKVLSTQDHLDLAMDNYTLLAAANQQLNQLRRDFLKPTLTANIRGSLCRAVKEEDPSEDLFPDFTEQAKAAKQASSYVRAGRSFGRSRGRRFGGGYHLYQFRGGYQGSPYPP